MPILDKNHFTSLVDGLAKLREDGYVRDFNQLENELECKELNRTYKPQDFTIVKTYRFEGMSSTGDNSVLYAIEANDGEKGVMVDAYGVYANAISPEMIQKFKVEYAIDSSDNA